MKGRQIIAVQNVAAHRLSFKFVKKPGSNLAAGTQVASRKT